MYCSGLARQNGVAESTVLESNSGEEQQPPKSVTFVVEADEAEGVEEAPFKSRLFFLSSLHDASPQRAWLCVGVHTINFGIIFLHDKPCPDLQSQVGPVSHETKELTAHAHPTSVASQLVRASGHSSPDKVFVFNLKTLLDNCSRSHSYIHHL